MSREAGYTLVELVIGAAMMLTVTSWIFAVLGNGLGRSSLWNESAELHQRARVAIDAISAELLSAGRGTAAGPLSQFLPPVAPGRRFTLASTNAVTVRYLPEHAAWSTLASSLAPEAAAARIALGAGCALVAACGFTAGTEVVLFDRAGNWDLASITTVEADTLMLTDVAGARSVTYEQGATVAEVVETTLYFDSIERQLRRERPGGSALPVADNVVDLQLSYFGDRFTPLPLSMLTDGPFSGSGASAYDADLQRIRTIRATVRLQTGVNALRGQDPRLFARPGSATKLERMLPDVVLSIDISPRNLQR